MGQMSPLMSLYAFQYSSVLNSYLLSALHLHGFYGLSYSQLLQLLVLQCQRKLQKSTKLKIVYFVRVYLLNTASYTKLMERIIMIRRKKRGWQWGDVQWQVVVMVVVVVSLSKF